MQITLKLKQQLDVGNVRKASVSFALSDSSELLLLRPPHCVAATGSDMSAAQELNVVPLSKAAKYATFSFKS